MGGQGLPHWQARRTGPICPLGLWSRKKRTRCHGNWQGALLPLLCRRGTVGCRRWSHPTRQRNRNRKAARGQRHCRQSRHCSARPVRRVSPLNGLPRRVSEGSEGGRGRMAVGSMPLRRGRSEHRARLQFVARLWVCHRYMTRPRRSRSSFRPSTTQAHTLAGRIWSRVTWRRG